MPYTFSWVRNLSRISVQVGRYGCRQQACGLACLYAGRAIAVSCHVLLHDRIILLLSNGALMVMYDTVPFSDQGGASPAPTYNTLTSRDAPRSPCGFFCPTGAASRAWDCGRCSCAGW